MFLVQFTVGLFKGLEDLEIRLKTIQTTTLLRLARILRKVLDTCCLSNFCERPSANADKKKTLKKENTNTTTTTTTTTTNNNNNNTWNKDWRKRKF